MKKLVWVLMVWGLALAVAGPTWACTIFEVSGTATHYFASNEDWSATDPAMRVEPGDGKHYGYIVFGWEAYLPGYPQGGVNEHGVCLDWASLTPQPFRNDPGKKTLDEDIFYKILKQCQTVAEAIRLVGQYNCPHLAEEHLLVADRSGASCIIEWSERGYAFIRKDRNYQVITNFSVVNPKVGWYPCERFQTVDRELRTRPKEEVDLAAVTELLRRTHQEGQYQTIYSYIVDARSLDIYVFYRHDFSKYVKYNFAREVRKGRHQVKLYP
ncbi:acyl-CoA:6-aminopenicillanic acid acyl transferase [Hydrogenispora ethanolica]|uniref:Acyl-CoA:6-aminopenicillanic acid acyl transferase n=1 Tax=Hydrogenispora ethanolica TaxID=1082276 RepID=A0A4R1S795_HYDET|nr:carcinine hydrolase/isopenicillin-N N-acyltransferase family protein [Hydrogenispora ethanolica]TCL75109.1 acyl-CoA:6-aminopenicillanic acid acyl transferase [Hydrogenispora ethanolica]